VEACNGSPVAVMSFPDDGDCNANAALIAAAPELYEALKELVELKAMSDANGPRAVYEERKPIAWENARAALSRVDQGKEQGGE
jgi:hypothetical protein